MAYSTWANGTKEPRQCDCKARPGKPCFPEDCVMNNEQIEQDDHEECSAEIERLRAGLHQICQDYCDWYDGRDVRPGMARRSAATVAYDLVSIARATLNPPSLD